MNPSNSNILQPEIKGLSHLLLQVSNLETAKQFYCGLLGLKVKSRSTFGETRLLISTHQGLGLTTYPVTVSETSSKEQHNVEHIAFWVENIIKLIQNLNDAGFLITEPKANEYGLSASVVDPDGNRIELIEKHQISQ